MPDQYLAVERKRRLFEELALPVLDDLFRFACRLERDPDRAADLIQDALLTAFRKFEQLKAQNAFRGWIHRIVWHTFVNGTRRHRPMLPLAETGGPEAPDAVRLRDPGSAPDERLIARRLAQELKAALDELPEPQRVAIFLIDVQEFTYAEVAEMLNSRPGTIAARVSRGRTALRGRLQHLARERGWS